MQQKWLYGLQQNQVSQLDSYPPERCDSHHASGILRQCGAPGAGAGWRLAALGARTHIGPPPPQRAHRPSLAAEGYTHSRLRMSAMTISRRLGV